MYFATRNDDRTRNILTHRKSHEPRTSWKNENIILEHQLRDVIILLAYNVNYNILRERRSVIFFAFHTVLRVNFTPGRLNRPRFYSPTHPAVQYIESKFHLRRSFRPYVGTYARTPGEKYLIVPQKYTIFFSKTNNFSSKM